MHRLVEIEYDNVYVKERGSQKKADVVFLKSDFRNDAKLWESN